MAQFAKIYTTILDSTLWEETPEARLVFLGMTFASDMDGYIPCRTISSLARRLNLSEEYVQRGLDVVMAPDPNSNNPEEEGRRVVRAEGGWRVVSKRRYVDQQSSKQAEWAAKQARYRERKAAKEAAQLGRLASREVKA